MKDFEDFLSDLKIFKCKDCGSKCVYQKTWEHDVCSGCKIKELEKTNKKLKDCLFKIEEVVLNRRGFNLEFGMLGASGEDEVIYEFISRIKREKLDEKTNT